MVFQSARWVAAGRPPDAQPPADQSVRQSAPALHSRAVLLVQIHHACRASRHRDVVEAPARWYVLRPRCIPLGARCFPVSRIATAQWIGTLLASIHVRRSIMDTPTPNPESAKEPAEGSR